MPTSPNKKILNPMENFNKIRNLAVLILAIIGGTTLNAAAQQHTPMCHGINTRDLPFQVLLQRIRDSVIEGELIEENCAFGDISHIPEEFHFLITLYHIASHIQEPGYTLSVRFANSERIFRYQLARSALITRDSDRFSVYHIYFNEFIAPIRSLPFVGHPSEMGSSIDTDTLRLIKCFVKVDDPHISSQEILSSRQLQSCIGD